MSRDSQTLSFPWTRYSRRLQERILKPLWAGHFSGPAAGMRLVIGVAGSVDAGNCVQLSWLVDESDGIIADAKFLCFGQSALIGAADAACELTCGKNYDQANRIGVELIDKHLRDRKNTPAFPAETNAHLNLVVEAIEVAAARCQGMPLPVTYATPMPLDIEVRNGGYPGFVELTKAQKLSVIEQVIAEDIRPYIELDAGGIDILDLNDEGELLIAYSGACTSCHSATGMTLSYIQQLVRAKVHPELTVVPDLTAHEAMISDYSQTSAC